MTLVCPHLPNGVVQLFDRPLRDPFVCVAPDGWYYLTGTTGDWWRRNSGIELWRSQDLSDWEPLGQVWTTEDGTWQKEAMAIRREPDGTYHAEPDADGVRVVWSPELHYLKGTYWLTYCCPGRGSSLLRSTTGRPEGPYEDVQPSGPIVRSTPDRLVGDGSLFEDDDGSVWMVCGAGWIGRMRDDMTGLATELTQIRPADHTHVGFEGPFMTKVDGRYHLFASEFQHPELGPVDAEVFMDEFSSAYSHDEVGDEIGRHNEAFDRVGYYYSCMSASAPSLLGPWGPRYVVAEHAGHNMVFQDREGAWWSTFFGSDPCAPIRERPGILRMTTSAGGRWMPA